MNKNTINIGIPSKGRLKNDTLNIFKKKKLRIYSERGERDLFGYIKKSNVKIIYLHARECIEQLSLGNIDVGFSGIDLLKESEINIQNTIKIIKKYEFGKANLVLAIPAFAVGGAARNRLDVAAAVAAEERPGVA